MNTTALQSPAPLHTGENPAEAWERWKKKFLIYSVATVLQSKPVAQQRALLLHIIGDTALDIYLTFGFVEDDEAPTVETILTAFDNHFQPFKNTLYKRHLFFTCDQKPSQRFDEYVTELKTMSADCEFGVLRDSLIMDRVIIGIQDVQLKSKLLQEPELTLAKTIDFGRAAEQSKSNLKKIVQDDPEVNVLYRPNLHTTPRNWIPQRFGVDRGQGYSGGHMTNSRNVNPRGSANNHSVCFRCGLSHMAKQCQAYGKHCLKCGKLNHFAKVCRQRVVHMIEEQDAKTDELYLESLTLEKAYLHALHSDHAIQWIRRVFVEGNELHAKLDTGAQANVLPLSVISTWSNKPKLKSPSISILTYTGQKVPVVGECYLNCDTGQKNMNIHFAVVDVNSTAILGLKACIDLGLIAKLDNINSSQQKSDVESPQAIINRYDDVFQGLGSLPRPHHIELKEGTIPRIQATRRVPQAIKEIVRLELQEMEKLGIIMKVNEPTDWVHPMVVVQKPNKKVRICIDPRELNQAIKRSHYQIPDPESIIAEIPEARYYSVLDAKTAFWQIRLDEESSQLLTMGTPFGRYRFLRLPYGICSAPEIFQREMHELYGELKNAKSYIDDVITWGQNDSDHITNLEQVLEVARESNLKLSKEKLQLAQTEVKFLGHAISKEGVRVDENKVQAILSLKPPTDKKSLQRLLGLYTYISKYIPNLSDRTQHMRQLLKEGNEWLWDMTSQQEFENLKLLVSNAPVLQHFRPDEEVTLSVDASQQGLGAVLLQRNLPVIYASATLQGAQTNYAQIEKELLALYYGCQRFHYYLYGRRFVAQTDHKPLLGIMKKPFDTISPRLQRLVLKLQQYDIDLRYIPGRELLAADLLSRDTVSTETIDTADIDEQAQLMTLHVSTTPQRLIELEKATSDDLQMAQLKKLIEDGWPDRLCQVPNEARRFWHCRDELHFWKGLICRGERIVIPREHRKWVLSCIHSAHQGITACKSRAREAVYWPNMSTEIEELIKRCETCQASAKSNQREPMQPHEVPDRPWQKVAIDLFYIHGTSYLLMTDYYSKYPEVSKVGSTAAPSTLPVIKSVFARHGIPECIVTDNGPPFSSKEFADFVKVWDIKHTTTSPTYPQSNGLVERGVQTIKQLIKKTLEDEGDIYLSLMAFRATPHNGLPSPAEVLMGRRIRTTLPTKDTALMPKPTNAKEIRKQLERNQATQRQAYDRNSSQKQLTPLKSGQPVRVNMGPRKWISARVVTVGPEPRSYVVQTTSGSKYRRNRIHLRPEYPQSSIMEKCVAPSGKQKPGRPLVHTEIPIDDEPGSIPRRDTTTQVTVPPSPRPVIPPREVCQPKTTRSGRVVSTPRRYKN